jgi:hypothetical protein
VAGGDLGRDHNIMVLSTDKMRGRFAGALGALDGGLQANNVDFHQRFVMHVAGAIN